MATIGMRLGAGLALCVWLAGCGTASISGNQARWPWAGELVLCEDTALISARTGADGKKPPCTNAFNVELDASQFCRDVGNFYESGGRRSDSLSLAAGTFGVLAGSVFAPAAGGTAKNVWSGLSGATNAFQVSLDEKFGQAVAIQRHIAVKRAMDDGRKLIDAATGETNKARAAYRMAVDCSMAPARAESDALRLLTLSPTINVVTPTLTVTPPASASSPNTGTRPEEDPLGSPGPSNVPQEKSGPGAPNR